MTASLWAIDWWEALLPLAVALALGPVYAVTSERARRNRAKLRRRRRSEQVLARRMRTW